MSGPRWRMWLDQPQNVPFRRALYRIHLWVGIATGLYILMMSLSGSAVVFRRELTRWLMPPDGDFEAGFPLALRIMEWLVDLHDNLLAGPVGLRFTVWLGDNRRLFCVSRALRVVLQYLR